MNKSFIYKFTVMKKILFSLFMLSLLSTSVIAQQPIQKSGDNNRNKEMHNTPKPDMKKDNKKCCMSVAETTKLQTEQLKTLLQLSDEQTRKVHAILLRGNQNDSIMNIQVEKMRKDQMAQHTAQAEAIKKNFSPLNNKLLWLPFRPLLREKKYHAIRFLNVLQVKKSK